MPPARESDPHALAVADGPTFLVERVQTGVRIQKELLKVLKGLAEYLDISLSDLLEGILLHSLEGRTPFNPTILEQIEQLKKIYGLRLNASASHKMVEARASSQKAL